PKKPSTMEESRDTRYSLNIDEDLKRPPKKIAPPVAQNTAITLCEDTVCEGAMGEALDRDDSFDAFERMCDKTGSDPDSTLFQYLNSEDKSQVMALAKNRSAERDLSSDDRKEIDALRRMLEAVGTEDLLDNESPLKGVECTQLEDVEAPSRFWDNDATLADESRLEPQARVSPVKMVGLLRPSTIIEANENDSDVSSQVSFQSARTRKTNVSSCYETATDSSLLSVDNLFYAAIAKAKPPGMSKKEELELLSDLHGSLKELTMKQENPEASEDEVENTIIELSSSEDEEIVNISDVKQEDITREEEPVVPKTESDAGDKENEKNESMHFNDTMEEIQYMMQKGREYIAGAASSAPAKPESPEPVKKQSTFVVSPKKATSKYPASEFLQPSLPLRPCNKPLTVPKPSSTKSTPVKHDLNLEWTRRKFFGTPSGIPTRRQQQIKEQPFANVVSPIRTYTQKSGTAPLMSMFRQTSADVFSTLAVSELEQESRLCQPKLKFGSEASTANSSGGAIRGIDSTAQLLPKKAYISSDIKHVVDERTPLPMPNVPRIQKYLNTAVEPTVLRHDGKMKTPTDAPVSNQRRAHQSLADLSLASGDVSLYTIRDAQKF
ncbi:hypothetical protein KR018_006506, partial [Drosophila ironensis]